jgi:hypothetical protein
MYTSVGGGRFTLFLMIVLGLFTVGVGAIPVWMLSVLWAYLSASHSRQLTEAPPGPGADR